MKRRAFLFVQVPVRHVSRLKSGVLHDPLLHPVRKVIHWRCLSLSISGLSSTCIPDSSSGIAFPSLCCPLPLAVSDADFMGNLLFGFGLGSIGSSLGSDPAGSVGSVSDASAAALSLLFFLCSPLRTSSVSASLITSSLRSNLSAPW